MLGVIIALFPPVVTWGSYYCKLRIPYLFLWIVLMLVLTLLFYVIFSIVRRKKNFSQSLKEVGLCLLFSSMTLISIGPVIWIQNQNRQKLKDDFSSLIVSEQRSYDIKMSGVADFHAKNYPMAAILLKQHLTDPIAKFYYGYMLYNGLGVQMDERKGLDLIRSSADEHFYRAMGFMVNWGASCGKIEEIVPYAEMMVYAVPNSFSLLNNGNSIKEFALKQFLSHLNDCLHSYRVAYIYYAFIHKSYYKLWCLTNDYEMALSIYRKQHNIFDVDIALDHAWGMWRLESKFVGRLLMWYNANIKFSQSDEVHFDYALMLLDVRKVRDMDYEHISLVGVSKGNLQSAERELDKALSIAIAQRHITMQCKILQLLVNILRVTGCEDDADKLSIILSNLKLKKYYEELDN